MTVLAGVQMLADYNQRCSEKACPFQTEPGALLCRFHRQSFTYGMSMEGNAVPFTDSLRSGLNTGFRLPARPVASTPAIRQINREDRRIRVLTQILATGNLLPGILTRLDQESLRGRDELFSNLEPAQDLFRVVRYPDGPFCLLCGNKDISRNNYYSRMSFWCPLCRYTRTLLAQTMFVTSFHEANELLRAIWILRDGREYGCLKELQQIGFCASSAVRFNRKIRICGEAVGVDIGYSSKRLTHLEDRPVHRARNAPWGHEHTCPLCDRKVIAGELYRTKHREGSPWLHENCFQLALAKTA